MEDKTKQAIHDHALAEFPKECCGLVVIVRGKEVYLPCDNQAATPHEHFIIPAEQYAQAEELGEIVGVVHSHPNQSAAPSQADRVACEASGLPWHIASVGFEGVEEIRTHLPSGYEAPLVGRTFAHGVLDCYSLVRDWYARECGIQLPNYERADRWWDNGQSLYVDNFAAAGFVKTNGGPLQRGDIVLMQLRAKTPNHAAVYIGDGNIMHHMHGRLSSRDVYGGYWQENTVMIVRYKEPLA